MRYRKVKHARIFEKLWQLIVMKKERDLDVKIKHKLAHCGKGGAIWAGNCIADKLAGLEEPEEAMGMWKNII